MSARDELAEIKSRAEKFIAAHDEMLRIDQGIGGLAIERPDLMPDYDAWSNASDVEHADTVLAVIAASKPRTITTLEELDALLTESVVRSIGGVVWEKYPDDDDLAFWMSPGSQRANSARAIGLPATVLYEPAVTS
jgi:hypothetical protein